MITIAELDTEMNAIREAFPAIEHYIRVVTEDQATARLHDRAGPCLVVTLPSFQQTGDAANPSGQHAILLWIVEKPDSDATEQEERDQYARLQTLIVTVKEYIRERQETGCSIWWRLNISSINIDPEYNVFGGFNGWMMALNF
jgi:hypothetical protein